MSCGARILGGLERSDRIRVGAKRQNPGWSEATESKIQAGFDELIGVCCSLEDEKELSTWRKSRRMSSGL